MPEKPEKRSQTFAIANLARKIGFLITLSLFLFAGLELSLRFLRYPSLQYYRDLKLLHRYHPDYLVGLEPDIHLHIRQYTGLWEADYSTNSMGYRGSPEVDPSLSRIVCLGDSIVMGFGVSDQDTFCNGLNGLTIGDKKYQSINLGVDAYGSLGNELRLEEAANRMPINIALFVVSPNDFTLPQSLREQGIRSDDENDALRLGNAAYERDFRLQFQATRYSYALMAMKLAYEQLRVKYVETREILRSELIIAGLLRPATPGEKRFGILGPMNYFLNSFREPRAAVPCRSESPAGGGKSEEKRAAGAIPGSHDGTGSEISEAAKRDLLAKSDPGRWREMYGKAFCPRPVPPDIHCSPAPPAEKELADLPAITMRAYDGMIQTAKTHGFKFVLVELPIQREELYCGSNGQYSSFSDYSRRAAKYFRAKGATILDLSPYLSEMCGEPVLQSDGHYRPSVIEDYYIPGDGHFTVLGNRWVKRALIRELERLGRANVL